MVARLGLAHLSVMTFCGRLVSSAARILSALAPHAGLGFRGPPSGGGVTIGRRSSQGVNQHRSGDPTSDRPLLVDTLKEIFVGCPDVDPTLSIFYSDFSYLLQFWSGPASVLIHPLEPDERIEHRGRRNSVRSRSVRGTESLQTLCWRRQSGANSSLKGRIPC